MEERTITITVEEFKNYIKMEEKIEQIAHYTNNTEYSISREKIAGILGFELKKVE